MLELAPEICSDYKESSAREWIETNGLGGYASGTISGALTRRYHGLLTVATEPPVGRIVTVSKLEETLILNGVRFDLSTNRYADAVYPHGFRHLKGFRLDPFPVWTFGVGGVEIERTLFMVHGENSTAIRWRVVQRAGPPPRCSFEVRPLIAFRDHHHLSQGERANFDLRIEGNAQRISMQPESTLPRVHFVSNAINSEPQEFWYRNFEYAVERERGFDYTEDLYQPFTLNFDLASGAELLLTTDPDRSAGHVNQLQSCEIQRRAELVARSGVEDKARWPLVLAADQFIVNRGAGKSVLAGYHWFSDWGRDTMIALQGLSLSTNRPDIAKSILLEYSKHISQGMIPNRFPDSGGKADYNTVDATLWYFEAVRAYTDHTDDYDLLRDHLYEKLVDIIEWHVSGTRYQIHVDTDGLLYAGEPGVQLTWMDAKIDDWVVTPRTGKPVEIQALWYNALRFMADLAASFNDKDHSVEYADMAGAARESFNDQFWNEGQNCLYDVISSREKDASVRPNQIFAVSLHFTMLEQDRARSVLDKVEAELLTPVGLRSLSPSDPRYTATYGGSPKTRDAGYHQGTTWSWLIGPFVDAYRRVHGYGPTTDAKLTEITAGLRSHLSSAMVGQVSEIFDGVAPHRPRGAAAQAWSVAELLRVLPK
jgi:predicted glycogen debranching enzyme